MGRATRLNFVCQESRRDPRRIDGLWRHTCFEAFVKPRAGTSYREFNFAPSTEWGAYGFSGYREGMIPSEEEWVPAIGTRAGPGSFELEATIRAVVPVTLALAAVIEDENGRLSYWALRHPSGKPDFHHPDSFALEL